jgi:hypothetical protein
MSGPPGLMVDVEAFLGVEALVLGDVVAGELRLRHPFELQRHGLAAPRCLEGGQRHRAGRHAIRSFFISFPFTL